MDSLELLIGLGSIFLGIFALINWYSCLSYKIKINKVSQIKDFFSNLMLTLAPIISTIIVFITLIKFAAFDVVDNPIYIAFYLAIWLGCIELILYCCFSFFDINWKEDAMATLESRAESLAITSCIISGALIYAGSNIGDGPGWWCVFFAGGLGLVTWFAIGFLLNIITKITEKITIEKDISCAIRFGGFMLACGIILARASGGDWTSFLMTIQEFLVGWTIIPLTIFAIIVETLYKQTTKMKLPVAIISSLAIATIYITIAVTYILYLPSII